MRTFRLQNYSKGNKTTLLTEFYNYLQIVQGLKSVRMKNKDCGVEEFSNEEEEEEGGGGGGGEEEEEGGGGGGGGGGEGGGSLIRVIGNCLS